MRQTRGVNNHGVIWALLVKEVRKIGKQQKYGEKYTGI